MQIVNIPPKNRKCNPGDCPLSDEPQDKLSVSLAEIDEACKGIPETKIEIDRDGDILIYRVGPIPEEPEGTDKLSEIRRKAIRQCCPYTKANAYWIDHRRCTSLWEALDWLAHIGEKKWHPCLFDLAVAIHKVVTTPKYHKNSETGQRKLRMAA